MFTLIIKYDLDDQNASLWVVIYACCLQILYAKTIGVCFRYVAGEHIFHLAVYGIKNLIAINHILLSIFAYCSENQPLF